MVRNLKQIIREELNDFEWIKDIEPKIPFSSVNPGDWYDVELTDEFFNMMEGCGERIDDFYDITHVRVINKQVGVDHDFVYCESYSDEKIDTVILLEFYGSDGNSLKIDYWVTEEMVRLSPRQNINESEEFNDFEWTKEIKPAKDQFPLEKETLYYFIPNISMDRVRDTLIPKLKNTRGMKSSVIKSLTNISEKPRYQREGIKFFYTDNLSKDFAGWCSISEIEVYEWLDKVDGYEYFEIKPY